MDRHQGLASEIEQTINTYDVIDCHEHTYLPDRRPNPTTLATIVRDSDVGDDLISAGMPASLRAELSWERAAPYFAAARNTGFMRSLMIAFRDLFGLADQQLTAENWHDLSQRITAANQRPGWYADLLQRGRIRCILRVQGDEPQPYAIDRSMFAPLIIFDPWIRAAAPEERERLMAPYGGSGHKLPSYLAALDAALDEAVAQGAAGIKSMLAYHRSIAHSQPDASEIVALLGHGRLKPHEVQIFEDFMVHEVAERAGRRGLPYQLHTGYGSWQSNITAQANPLLLNPLIEAHRKTQFVLLHGGYPFIAELGTMAKNHPNVQIEAGWLAYIAPAAYRRALVEWLDSVPMSKITAFGADCLCIEQTYGALALTRRLLAQALATKVLEDGWSESLALEAAERLLMRNAAELYRLPSSSTT